MQDNPYFHQPFKAQQQQRQQQQQQSTYYPQVTSCPAPPSTSSSSAPQLPQSTTTHPGMSLSPNTQFSHSSKRSISPESSPSGKKKRRIDDEEDDKKEKIKLTRGSRACTVCRRLKMKCEGAENGPPCKRCIQGSHDCVFEESMRGKRNHKKQEALTGKLQSLEQQINSLQASIPSSTAQNAKPEPSPHSISLTPSSLVHSTPVQPSQSPLTPAHPLQERKPSQPSSAPSSPLPSLPDNTLNPLGLLAEASIQKYRSAQRQRERSTPSHPHSLRSLSPPVRDNALLEYEDELAAHAQGIGKGIAGESYFKPGPMTLLPIRRLVIERQVQPEILEFVDMQEVFALFEIFYTNLNRHCCLFDREVHTPPLICSRSPFLLTAICAISSKFYKGREDNGELQGKLNNVAKKLAWSTPAQGYKSVEIVQAYLLLALWGTGPVQRFEQDRTWLLLGMAIRMATDLNLHRASPTSIPLSGTYVGYDNELEEENGRKRRKRDKADIAEVRNRERTWILCYNLDRSLSAQMGKPYSIQEDYIIRNAGLWAQHPDALPGDKALCGFLDYQRILSRCVEFFYAGTSDPSGLLKACDWSTIIKAYEAQLAAWRDGFHKARDQEVWVDPDVKYRKMVSALQHNYSLLVINTFGLHHAREHSHVDVAHFFSRCYSTAVECARIITEQLGPSGYLKYSPDSHFVLCSYAVITLLKLVRLEFENYLPTGVDPIKNVRDAADVLAKVAVNKYHTPALYAAFLRALINVRDGTSGPATRHTSVAPTPGPPPHNASSTGEVLEPFVEVIGEPTIHIPHTQQHETAPPIPVTEYNMVHHPMVYGEGMTPFHYTFQPPTAPALSATAQPNQTQVTPDFAEYGFGTNAGLSGNGMDADELSNLNGPFGGILTDAFWDSVLIPGYSNTLDLSGGFVFGSGGSGLITPRIGSPPFLSTTLDFGTDSLQHR